MPEPDARPLWVWILLGAAPGLFCDLLILMLLLGGSMSFGVVVLYVLVAMPVVGTVYLGWLGFRYVEAGMGKSVLLFMLQFWLLNAVLVGAGCGLISFGSW